MLEFLTHLILTAAMLLLMANLVRGVQVESWGSALIGAMVLGFVNAVVRPLMILFTLPPHDSHLWALSPGGQRAHAVFGGGTRSGHPRSRFWARLPGKPSAHVTQYCR